MIGIHPDYVGVELITSTYEPNTWPRNQTILESNIVVLIPLASTSKKVVVSVSIA